MFLIPNSFLSNRNSNSINLLFSFGKIRLIVARDNIYVKMFKDQRDLLEKLFAGVEDCDLKMDVKL